jgi:hypothetical protein
MTRRAIEREIEDGKALIGHLYTIINRKPSYTREWLLDRVHEIEIVQASLDELTALLATAK